MLVLKAQDFADPYLETIEDRLMVAAACHVLVPSVSLDQAFWTAPDALWKGRVAAGLPVHARLSCRHLGSGLAKVIAIARCRPAGRRLFHWRALSGPLAL